MTGKPANRVGLFCAIPSTRSEFVRGLVGTPGSDYVKAVLCEGRPRPDAWDAYSSKFDFIQTKFKELRQLGVAVHTGVETCHFAGAFGAFDVVVLLTHWKGTSIGPTDIAAPVALAQSLLGRGDEEAEFLRSLIGYAKLRDIAQAMDTGDDLLPSRLASALDELVAHHDLAPFGNCEDIRARNRDHLAQIFHPLLHPGNRLEFADRRISAEEAAELVPPTFQGVLELMVCHSADLLANRLQVAKPDCICISNVGQAIPHVRLIRLVFVCAVMRRLGCGYTDAISIARDMLDNSL